jgi:hypothetical protein
MYQAARPPSATLITAQNILKDADSHVPNSTTITDSNDKDLEDGRGAVTRLSVDHPEWLKRSTTLACLLSERFEKTGRETFLEECIDIRRWIYAVCTPGSPNSALSSSDLALSLRRRFKQTGEESLLIEAIELGRKALFLQPKGHIHRSISCNSLALSLWTHFTQSGEESLLDEAIDLHKEALSLRPSGHPSRSQSCSNLALALWTSFNQTGEKSLLTEAIDLNREALSLRPTGHPERTMSCNNLASTLYMRFNQTGEESLLVEAIDLDREALYSRPSGHPDRSMSCSNLASSLMTRFNQTGEELLLVESIELAREAMSLRFSGHPDWSSACNNLAISLWARFNQTSEPSLLTEVIELHREALSHRPSGHPDRFMSCSNLGLSLYARFNQAREESLLIEAIHLHREALSLQTCVHPHRLEVCNRLIASLRAYFEITGDESLLVEAIDLSKDTMEIQPHHHTSRWKIIIHLSHIHLNRRFSQRNALLAINFMQQALLLVPDDWPALLAEIAQLTSLIHLPVVSQKSLSQLLQCFSAAIDLASRFAGFVLDPQSQLRYMSSSQHLGPRAYWCALSCGQPELGLELIERARAMIWNQALHRRSPQLGGAPPELRSELEVLLSKMYTSRVTEDPMSLSHNQDVRHKDNVRINQLIHQIRALPGQERFMRGPSFKELGRCACRNAVVVLVATEGESHALILRPNNQDPVTLHLPGITPKELTNISAVVPAAQRRGSVRNGVRDDNRGVKVSHFKSDSDKARSDPSLRKLWETVVKPIIDCLQFPVRATDGSTVLFKCN